MIRHQCFYQLFVLADHDMPLNEQADIAQMVCTNPDLPLEQADVTDPVRNMRFQTPNELGTVEAVAAVMDIVRTWSIDCGPRVLFDMVCTDEEAHAEHFFRFRDGENLCDRHSRVVPATNIYDELTVNAIVKFLNENPMLGATHQDIANTLAVKFARPNLTIWPE